jgi:hypothetical protein
VVGNYDEQEMPAALRHPWPTQCINCRRNVGLLTKDFVPSGLQYQCLSWTICHQEKLQYWLASKTTVPCFYQNATRRSLTRLEFYGFSSKAVIRLSDRAFGLLRFLLPGLAIQQSPEFILQLEDANGASQFL